MKAMTTACCEMPVLPHPALSPDLTSRSAPLAALRALVARAQLLEHVELTKPRVAVLVLFTVAIGAFLAPGGLSHPVLVLHTLIGTALVAAGASAWNQVLERHSDGLMRRTESRPLPSGRLQPLHAALFGTALGVAGIVYLVAARQPWSALIAAVTFLSYAFVYTPLKRKTIHNTLVGALPGALPPVIGWVAVPGALNLHDTSWAKLLTLFLVMFCWQIPHFMAIAWIYRKDYSRAGLRMMPGRDDNGKLTAQHMVLFCVALVAVSVAPVLLGAVGPVYLIGALVLGLVFLLATIGFGRSRGMADARRVLRWSLVYLPCLLGLLLVDMMLV